MIILGVLDFEGKVSPSLYCRIVEVPQRWWRLGTSQQIAQLVPDHSGDSLAVSSLAPKCKRHNVPMKISAAFLRSPPGAFVFQPGGPSPMLGLVACDQ